MSDAITRFFCPSCRKRFKSRLESPKSKITCTSCGQALLVPVLSSPADDAIPSNVDGDLLSLADQMWFLHDHENAWRFHELRASLTSPELCTVVFGEFNRGKSTLINALLGRLVLPAKLVPTTGHVTQITFGVHEQVRVQLAGGDVETRDLDRLDSFSSLNCDGLARDDIESIEVHVNCPMLRNGIAILDTPGINEKDAQTRRAMGAITKADLVLLVLDARQLLTADERGLAIDWLTRELGKLVVPIVNFTNALDESEKCNMRQRLDRWCHDLRRLDAGPRWFEVNALGALRHALNLGGIPDPQIDALRSALMGCTGKIRRAIQGQSRRGQMVAEVHRARRENLDLLQRIRANAVEEEKRRSEQLVGLEESHRRIIANARLLRERICFTTQRTLEESLDSLTNHRLPGNAKAELESQARQWYHDHLSEAIRNIEKSANDALLRLWRVGLQRPAPMTILEQMTLNSRLDVGELLPIQTSAMNRATGAVVGGVLGALLLAPVGLIGAGAAFGVQLGYSVAKVLGQQDPDYLAAYRNLAEEKWASDASKVIQLVQSQFDVRVNDLDRQMKGQLTQLTDRSRTTTKTDNANGAPDERGNRVGTTSARTLAVELKLREKLEATLMRCERSLQSI